MLLCFMFTPEWDKVGLGPVHVHNLRMFLFNSDKKMGEVTAKLDLSEV